jgi:electron transfer flavoprotein-quinone oxidoreductase
MSEEEKFDAIIIGAGLAGSAAAYKLAKEGLEVVLVERGPYPGSKNLSGGVMYGQVLHQLIPEFWKEAPVERHITNQVITFMTEDASFSADYKSQEFSKEPYNGFSVLRAKFDRWLGEKAEEAGAMLVPGIKVDKVLRDENRVTGIQAGDEEMLANVIIAADGANSFIAQEAGLMPKLTTEQMAVGVKELIELPRDTIEERFGLSGDEGTAYGLVGYATHGMSGGGFLYTNKESISIGIVVHLNELVDAEIKPFEVAEDFLAHPLVAPLIKDGKLVEYGAHLVHEGGVGKMAKLFTDGMLVVGDAAGLAINNGLTVRGMDLAIGSGVAAAEAVLEAKKKEDYSAQSLSIYQKLMDESFVMRDMRTYAKAPGFMENRRLYETYPKLMSSLMTNLFQQESKPKENIMPTVMKSLKESKISLIDLALDGWKGVRSL